MVMLTTALDISYDEPDHSVLILAGFVSDAKDWKSFDEQWRAILLKYAIPYFQAQKCQQFSEHFRRENGWDELRRRDLMNDLLEVIQSHAYRKFGIIVESNAADALFPHYPTYKYKMIQIALGSIVAMVEGWRERDRWPRSPRYVFEQGDDGKGVIMGTMERMGLPIPGFEPGKPGRDAKGRDVESEEVFTPLQAADLFAYELKKLVEQHSPVFPGQRFRYPYEILNKMDQDAQVFRPASAEYLNPILDVDRYFKENPLA